MNFAKCELTRGSVTYLGQVAPVQAKVLAIEQFLQPVANKEFMRFLGMWDIINVFVRTFHEWWHP